MKITKDIKIVFFLCFLVGSFGLIPFMGIPGALIITILEAPLQSLGLYPGTDSLGPSAWGLAIAITLTWPAGVFVSYLFAFYMLKELSTAFKWLIVIVLPLIFSAILMWHFTKNYDVIQAEMDARTEQLLEELNESE